MDKRQQQLSEPKTAIALKSVLELIIGIAQLFFIPLHISKTQGLTQLFKGFKLISGDVYKLDNPDFIAFWTIEAV